MAMLSKFFAGARSLLDIAWPPPSEHELEIYAAAQEEGWNTPKRASRDDPAANIVSEDGFGGLGFY